MLLLILLLIVNELGIVTEVGTYLEWVQQEQDHVVELDPILLIRIHGFLIVGLSHTTEEIYEFLVR